MQKFIIKELITSNIESELEKIGFDIAYRNKAADKFRYKTLKIFGLTLPQANILKQTALSLGADCGVHKDVLTSQIEKTDVILGGSYSQLKKISEKLKFQPFSMKNLSEDILSQLESEQRKTKIVGILNITPDSFSDGGKYFSIEDSKNQFYQLIADGADVIDIGAESTRPGAIPVTAEEQIKRLTPILEEIKNVEIPISIDTRDSNVAKYALEKGASIINDVSGLNYDSHMAKVIADYNATVVIQHSTAKAEDNVNYKDVVEDVYKFLLEKYQYASEIGVKNIILDPGIGFGKSKLDNFEILNRIEEFYSLNCPLMVGISRKSFLGLKNSNDNNLKDNISLAVSYPLMQKNVDYLRVHNVKLHKQLLKSAI